LAKPALQSLKTLSWLTVNREPVYRPLQFQKRSQHFIGTHHETLSVVTVRVNNPDRSPLKIKG
jgi:hypothetical protein